ncbi:hypothetical protein DPMN_009554 [Dreissena polymorpha]|uniref:Uncharacterized protein n=1 Tax=Dreissena polymorpha TaxID=45954 RepID=A0A9D4N1H0_DREPO|nr:hypothetical protein DPMN_009554 [Dreissena polymorpha]
MSPPVLNDLVIKRESRYHFRYTNLLEIPQVKSTKYGTNSFRHAAPDLWNALPESHRKANVSAVRTDNAPTPAASSRFVKNCSVPPYVLHQNVWPLVV